MAWNTRSTNNFPLVTDTDVVPKPKWHYKSNRIQNARATVGDTVFSTANVAVERWTKPEVIIT